MARQDWGCSCGHPPSFAVDLKQPIPSKGRSRDAQITTPDEERTGHHRARDGHYSHRFRHRSLSICLHHWENLHMGDSRHRKRVSFLLCRLSLILLETGGVCFHRLMTYLKSKTRSTSLSPVPAGDHKTNTNWLH